MTRFIFIALLIAVAYNFYDSWNEHRHVEAFYNELKNDPHVPEGGNPNYIATVVEYFDYKCGYCKLQEDTFTTLLKDGNPVRIVFMELPIFGDSSITAAKAALAVNHIDSKKYFPYHHALMAKGGPLTMQVLKEEAQKLGINPAILDNAMENPHLTEELSHIRAQAHALGIYGTPGLIVDGRVVHGAMALEPLQDAIGRDQKNQISKTN